jgi:hypothetical protein
VRFYVRAPYLVAPCACHPRARLIIHGTHQLLHRARCGVASDRLPLSKHILRME